MWWCIYKILVLLALTYLDSFTATSHRRKHVVAVDRSDDDGRSIERLPTSATNVSTLLSREAVHTDRGQVARVGHSVRARGWRCGHLWKN